MKHLLNDEQKERGEAGFSAELKDGVISIYHCEGHILLRQWEGSGNDWDTIWALFEKLETDSESIDESDNQEITFDDSGDEDEN